MTTMTIEEQIILQYAIPHCTIQEDASSLPWLREGVKRQRQADWDRIDQRERVRIEQRERDRIEQRERDRIEQRDQDRVLVPVNWDRVLELALFHDVFPSVYRRLDNTGWLAVPEEAVRKFRKNWHQHLARNLILSHEMDRVLELFAKGGVKAVPLKDIFLARLLYSNITLRSFHDLDIWIRPSDTERAGDLLQQIGYEPRFTAAEQNYSAENEYSIPFHRYLQHMRIYVDLHWSLAKSRDYPAIPEEHWWRQAREISISDQSSITRNFSNQRSSDQSSIYSGSSDQNSNDQSFSNKNSSGQRCFLLAPDDLLIYLTIQIHASTYCYLKHFIDIYQLLIRWGDRLDCRYIYHTAREMGMVNNLLFVLLTVRNLFDTPIDTSINASINVPINVPINNSTNTSNTFNTSTGKPNTPTSASINTSINTPINASMNAPMNTSMNTLIDTLMIQLRPDQKVKPVTGFLRFYLLRHIFNRQTILSGQYSRDLRQRFCLLLHDRLTQSIKSPLRVFFPSAEGITARYQLLPHSKKIYLYYCLNPFLIIYRLLRGLVVKSSGADGLGTLLGPVSMGQR